MREAIDYNALSWIRQEVGVTLKQARLELEEYAEGEQRRELLQSCTAHLHEARGPLRMVNIKGADMLACEMEEAIADLLLESVVDKDTLLEQLMQGFLELPEYLSNLRSGKLDSPRQLLPLINSLRACRGLQPLQEDTVFSPDLSARMPMSEFDGRSVHAGQDISAQAHTARVRFQNGLLEWYRDSSTSDGLQMLLEVLEYLQKNAASEPAARLWWIGAGVAELLRDRAIEAGPTVKRLFGQLDRQIKRLMDTGETVFTDVLSNDLVKNLLFQLAAVRTESPRVASIRSTYGIAEPDASSSQADADIPDIGEELLQTVSVTAREEVDYLKDQLDNLARNAGGSTEMLTGVANGLHSLGNTLGMIGMDRLESRLADEVQQLRDLVATGLSTNDADFTGLANALVAVEDALSDIAVHSGNGDAADDHGKAVLRQGQQAVVIAVMADITSAKDMINEFLKSSSEFMLLEQVPVLLNKIHGGLELMGEERLAVAARQVGEFISSELLVRQRQLNEDELDKLADAICSIEYCVEELSENHRFGERAIGVAIESLMKLGYHDAALVSPVTDVEAGPEPYGVEMPQMIGESVEESESVNQLDLVSIEQQQVESLPEQAPADEKPAMAELQVIAPDADSEIVEIFIEEAGEVLEKLDIDIPAWIANPDDRDLLADIRRAFHTIKGSGRMVGAMATGELAWSFESLLNRVIEGNVTASADLLNLVSKATSALKDLVAQVGNPDMILLNDIGELRREAAYLGQMELHDAEAKVSGFESEVRAQEKQGDKALSDQAAAIEEPVASLIGELEYEPVMASVPELSDAIGVAGQSNTEKSIEQEEVSGDAVAQADEEDLGADDVVDIDVLKPDADPEIVQIFLEEANEELAAVSLKIPEWIQHQDDGELLSDIRRSLHTLKGSGRMAGAMLIGEFAWSIETLLNKLAEGAVQPTGSMCALLSQVPQAISVLLRQLEDGADPGMDISGMIRRAADLANTRPVEPDQHYAVNEYETAAGILEEAESTAEVDDDDAILMQLFSTECGEHLDTLAASVLNSGETGMISDAHYRALHTLTGISESACVPGIGRLAAALYEYFGELYQDGRPATPEAYAVLDDCVREMSVQLRRLPGRSYDEDLLAGLLGRIAVLPAVTAESAKESIQPLDESMPLAELDGDTTAVFHELTEIPEIPSAALPVYPQQSVSSTPAERGDGDHPTPDHALADVSVTQEDINPEDADGEHPEFLTSAVAEEGERLAAEHTHTDVSLTEDELKSAVTDGQYPEVRIPRETGEYEQPPVYRALANSPVAEEYSKPSVAESEVASSVEAEGDIYSGMDQELFEIFVEEAAEIIDSSETVLRNWSQAPDDHEMMADFQRMLHTLKGGARMVDIGAIGDLSHALESLLTQVADGAVPAGDELFALLQESHDRLADMLEKVKSRAVVEAATDLESRLDAFKRGEEVAFTTEWHPAEDTIETQPASAAGQDNATEAADGVQNYSDQHVDVDSLVPFAGIQEQFISGAAESDSRPVAQTNDEQTQATERRKEGRARSELVRVQSDVLDNLVNNAGEINIYRSRMEQQISNYRFNLTELDQTISRLRDQLRQLEMETEAQILFRYEQEVESRNQEFDPLEMDRYSKLQQLSRSLIESISDLRSLHGLMDVTTRDSETLLLQQSRVSTDLQESLIRTRMIPFAGLAPRLRRIVRQSARQLDKKVDLQLRGAEGEMDRAVIERIVAPLEHMLRNAVAHGIETPERRKQAGKRDAGTITIDFNREGSEIVLHIRDDGAGLDIEAIRSRAVERGLMTPGMSLPDSDVMQFVLQTGFSTASEVTQISGRGVGMDVVNSEVKQLGGSLHIDSESGKGSVFTIRLPYTLAINQALLITVGEQIFCVPMGSVEGIVTASPEQLQSCYNNDKQEFVYVGQSYQLMHLGSLLGVSRLDLENAGSQIPVLLVRAGDKRIGVQIDSLLGSREVVIKPLGAQLSMVDGITGATILGDGRVVMILDMFAISRMKARDQATINTYGRKEDSRLVVMVVDDSITVRKVTSRLLERSGYKVMTAKDGVDAMGQLQDTVPDMMLLDIEMPRMDGFELATHMRNDERLKHIPIIMITSRTGDKHRERAFEIGVNEYLGKPYQESELLASINKIIGVNTTAVGA